MESLWSTPSKFCWNTGSKILDTYPSTRKMGGRRATWPFGIKSENVGVSLLPRPSCQNKMTQVIFLGRGELLSICSCVFQAMVLHDMMNVPCLQPSPSEIKKMLSELKKSGGESFAE